MTVDDGNRGKGSAAYPEGASFIELLNWHFHRGTRAKGSPGQHGAMWSRKELADRIGMDGGQPERTIGNWLNGDSAPINYYPALEQVLFGDSAAYEAWRTDFRLAFKAASQRAKIKSAVAETDRPAPRVAFIRAYNFEDTGVISRSEVELKGARDGTERSLFAQVDFFERLYVEGEEIRVEFGVARAFLAVKAGVGGAFKPNKRLMQSTTSERVRFVQSFKDFSFAISIGPAAGAVSLGELSLPPEDGYNQLCQLATTSPSVAGRDLRVEVHLRLNTEGLEIFDDSFTVSEKRKRQLAAIVKAAATCRDRREVGLVVYELDVADDEATDLVVT